jgi:flagellar basal body rod protein FlgF
MADPLNNYFNPLDNLIGSDRLGSRYETASELALNSNKKPYAEFKNILNDLTGKNVPPPQGAYCGCNPLTPINCDPTKSIDASRASIQQDIENSVSNIVNYDKPGYRKIFPFKDENGNPIVDESNGMLQKTSWQLDLALMGEGKGFKLENGDFTRDGRFKFDDKGRPVTVENNVPLKICYEEGAPVDWSLKQLKINFEGKVVDGVNGKVLGHLEYEGDEKSKVLQGYIERSNVNLPVEFMGLAQKLRLIDLTNGLFSTGLKLDSEALQLLKNL